jgi:hypothetical protein
MGIHCAWQHMNVMAAQWEGVMAAQECKRLHCSVRRAAVMVVLYNLPVDVLTAVLRDWIDITSLERLDSVSALRLWLPGLQVVEGGSFAKYNIGWERCDGVA